MGTFSALLTNMYKTFKTLSNKRSSDQECQVGSGMDAAFSTASRPAVLSQAPQTLEHHQGESLRAHGSSEMTQQAFINVQYTDAPRFQRPRRQVFRTNYPGHTRIDDWSSLTSNDRRAVLRRPQRGWFISEHTIRMLILASMICTVSAAPIRDRLNVEYQRAYDGLIILLELFRQVLKIVIIILTLVLCSCCGCLKRHKKFATVIITLLVATAVYAREDQGELFDYENRYGPLYRDALEENVYMMDTVEKEALYRAFTKATRGNQQQREIDWSEFIDKMLTGLKVWKPIPFPWNHSVLAPNVPVADVSWYFYILDWSWVFCQIGLRLYAIKYILQIALLILMLNLDIRGPGGLIDHPLAVNAIVLVVLFHTFRLTAALNDNVCDIAAIDDTCVNPDFIEGSSPYMYTFLFIIILIVVITTIIFLLFSEDTHVPVMQYENTQRYVIRVSSVQQLEEAIESYMQNLYSSFYGNANINSFWDENNMAHQDYLNNNIIFAEDNDPENKIFGHFTFDQNLINRLRLSVRNGQVKNCVLKYVNPHQNMAIPTWTYDDQIFAAMKEKDEKLKIIRDNRNNPQAAMIVFNAQQRLQNLQNITEGYSYPDKNLFIRTDNGNYTINEGHEIFTHAQYEERNNLNIQANNLVFMLKQAIQGLLNMTRIGDIRDEKSGNPEPTVLKRMRTRMSRLNRINRMKYSRTGWFLVPVDFMDLLLYKTTRNNKIDRNIIMSTINSMSTKIMTIREKSMLCDHIMDYAMPTIIDHLASQREAEELMKEYNEQAFTKPITRKMLHRGVGVIKYMWNNMDWGTFVRYIFLVINLLIAIGMGYFILNFIKGAHALPFQQTWVGQEAEDYALGPRVRAPTYMKKYIRRGDASALKSKPRYKVSRVEMLPYYRTDYYNTTCITNMRAGITDRMLVDNRYRTRRINKQAIYISHPEFYINHEYDNGQVDFQECWWHINGDFGRYAQEKAEEIANYLLREVGPNLDSDISKEQFEKFLHTKQYNQSYIKKMLNEVPDILGNESDYKQVPHYWSGFVKMEEYWKRSGPRNICACSSVTKMLGVALEHIQHAYFSRPQCIKLIPIKERPAYLENRYRGSGYIYQTDHSAFEGAQMDDIRQITEYHVLKRLFPRLWPLMNTIWRQGRDDDDHRSTDTIRLGKPGTFEWWTIPSVRMSGSPDTSLGNTIVNECVTHALLRLQGVTDYVATFEGDDALIMTKSPIDVDRCFDDSQNAGFKLKMEQKTSARVAGFLSTVWDEETLIQSSQDTTKILYNVFTHFDTKLKELGEQSYLKSKMLSALILNPGNEIFYRLWKKVEGFTRGANLSYTNSWYDKYKLTAYGLQYEQEKNRLIIKNIDVEKFIDRRGWYRIPLDLDILAIKNEIDKCTNLTQLYEVVRYIIDISPQNNTGIPSDSVYIKTVGGNVIAGGNEHKINKSF